MKEINFQKLKKNELKSIQAAMAMSTFNPSIGRTLPSGSVNKFIVSAIKELPKLAKIVTQSEFDNFHNNWCLKLKKTIRKCGYGSAQKAINVLLKMYIYWAKIPNNSKRLIKYIHVPLDSVIIEYFEKNYWNNFQKEIKPLYECCDYDCYNLKRMTKDQYLTWVKFIREIAGKNPPILIDIIWQVERLKKARKRSRA